MHFKYKTNQLTWTDALPGTIFNSDKTEILLVKRSDWYNISCKIQQEIRFWNIVFKYDYGCGIPKKITNSQTDMPRQGRFQIMKFIRPTFLEKNKQEAYSSSINYVRSFYKYKPI